MRNSGAGSPAAFGSIAHVLAQAQRGAHESCSGCPWNPLLLPGVGFGTSCEEHGVRWSAGEQPISMQIVQDPGNTTPQKTMKLCFVCNKENPTDRTAQNNDALWQAAVADTGEPYLRSHYWTNAMMHGASGAARNDQDLAAAHLHCQGVLAAQIDALAPRVIIASGKAAAESLHALGLLSSRWDVFRRGFAEGAYHEITTRNGRTIHVYCTYHTAARAVNTVAAPLHSPHTDALLRRKAEAVGRVDQVQAFLAPYAGRQDATSRGLRVLLLHWLDIGAAIRDAAHREPEPRTGTEIEQSDRPKPRRAQGQAAPDDALATLYGAYPAVIAALPHQFTSHRFLRELARQQQVAYIEALYAYRSTLRLGKPAPFMAVHAILAKYLHQYSALIRLVSPAVASEDIFGQDNTASLWEKVIADA